MPETTPHTKEFERQNYYTRTGSLYPYKPDPNLPIDNSEPLDKSNFTPPKEPVKELTRETIVDESNKEEIIVRESKKLAVQDIGSYISKNFLVNSYENLFRYDEFNNGGEFLSHVRGTRDFYADYFDSIGIERNIDSDGNPLPSSDGTSNLIPSDSRVGVAEDQFGVDMSQANIDRIKRTDNGDLNSVLDTSYIKSFKERGTQTGTVSEREEGELAAGIANVVNPPFQFHPNDDVRSNLAYPSIGRLYNERIRSNQPILIFTPGIIKTRTGGLSSYLGGGGQVRNNAAYIKNSTDDTINIGNIFRSIYGAFLSVISIFRSALYIFRPRFRLFRRYFNEQAAELAAYMGISFGSPGDGERPGASYEGRARDIDLLNFLPRSYQRRKDGLFGGTNFSDSIAQLGGIESIRFLPFLVGNDISVDETFSNSYTTNPHEEELNQASEAAEQVDEGGADVIENVTQQAKDLLNKLQGKAGAIKEGNGRIVFPQVWANSSFERNYSVSLELRSPYADKLSIFENIYVPLLILICLGAPLQTSQNTYVEPFTFKAHCRGFFSCPFGVLDSLTIERGEEKNDFTIDGFPRTVKVTLSIKDLIPSISISTGSALTELVNRFFRPHVTNIGMREFLSIMGGLSMADRVNSGRQIQFWWNKVRTKVSSNFTSTNILHGLSHSFIGKPFARVFYGRPGANSNADFYGFGGNRFDPNPYFFPNSGITTFEEQNRRARNSRLGNQPEPNSPVNVRNP